jgi:hypothetical protein
MFINIIVVIVWCTPGCYVGQKGIEQVGFPGEAHVQCSIHVAVSLNREKSSIRPKRAHGQGDEGLDSSAKMP